MSIVWLHGPREGYVHDETGVYRIGVHRGGWSCARLPATHPHRFGPTGEHTIGCTRVRITVTRRWFRSPALGLEHVLDTFRHPEAP